MTLQDLIARNLLTLVDTWTDDTLTLNLYSPAEGEETNPLLMHYRGIITDANYNVVMPNLPMPEEHVVGVDSNLDLEWPITCRVAYEGTLIRVFMHKGKPFISTNKRINAGESTWATRKSFLHYFQDVVGQDYQASPDYSLLFLLPTRDGNKVGSLNDPSEPVVFLVGAYYSAERGIVTKDELQEWVDSTQLALPDSVRLPESHRVTSYEDLLDSVERMTSDTTANPFGVSCPGFMYKHMRFVSQLYAERVRIRGNTPNLKLRYYELRAEGDREDLEAFMELYPHFERENVEKEIQAVIEFIHRGYKARFVEKQYIVLPKRLFQIVSACHAQYIATRSLVTVTKVRSAVEALSPNDLLLLTRDYRHAIQRSKDVLQLLR
jgi:hypothetical protein